ncbi:preprotein translocase subunit SecY [Atopobacter phocae]|uniref:preprotein translocase subunit SecY n=1 Tax=Atopobacter phocae TaxID=136492 RepID=UPI0004705C39|nr:preprotein translocase subunit SecY [Atopobacter phocae]
MFKLLKNAFQIKDIRQRIFFTLMMLLVFRLGSLLTVPGVNAAAIKAIASQGLFGLLNTFGGGALSQYSVFAMGVSPYITSSIVIQLLQMDIVPRFVEWSKQGEVGRRKLNQATRYATIVIAFVQSIGLSVGFNHLSQFGLIENPGIRTYLMISLVLTAGTMFLTWIGDMITVHGIGNGVSILIFGGIVARLPQGVYKFYQEYFKGVKLTENLSNVGFTVGLILAMLLIVIFVVTMETAQRRLPIQYSKRATGSHETSWLPLKINSAGVIPVIFASSFLTAPVTILGLFEYKLGDQAWYKVFTTIFNLREPAGMVLYTLLIVVFTYFYAFVQVNPEKVAENLQKQGGYIVNVRPGRETEKYLSGLLMRLSTIGALYLGVISLLPMIASSLWSLPPEIRMGGTSLLIVVGVALEAARQIEGRMLTRKYKGFIE